MSKIQRILDANANRAREAMRCMEDAARFVLDDAELSGKLKRLRHDFAQAIKRLPDLSLHRDTPGDVGTRIHTKAEKKRGDIAAVVAAEGKRLGESLRALAEYGKLVDAKFAAAVEQLRYRGYELETALNRRVALPDPRKWRVCVLVTESLCAHHSWLDVAKQSLDAGAQVIQLREKTLQADQLLNRAVKLVKLAERYERRAVIINDRPDVALLSGAHGVHLGQHDLSIEDVRDLTGHRLLIGCSTHNLAEARRAVRQKADYCGVGAMYETMTKRRRPSGPQYLKQFVKHFPGVPHLAIGGVNPGNIGELIEAGARAVAVCGCVCGAEHPDRVVRQLLRVMGNAA